VTKDRFRAVLPVFANRAVRVLVEPIKTSGKTIVPELVVSELMERVRFLVETPAALEALITIGKEPAALGVPLISPEAALNESPKGRGPEEKKVVG
jgi:hypothetical protein